MEPFQFLLRYYPNQTIGCWDWATKAPCTGPGFSGGKMGPAFYLPVEAEALLPAILLMPLQNLVIAQLPIRQQIPLQ